MTALTHQWRIGFLSLVSAIVYCLFSFDARGDVPSTSSGLSSYDVADGLSQNTVAAIAQDSRGFIWIGTQDGLNRFDGYEFETFRQQADAANALTNSRIEVIHLDGLGRLWVGTNAGGLHVLLPDTLEFVHITVDGALTGVERVTALAGDTDTSAWVATSGGIYHVAIDADLEVTLTDPGLASINGRYISDLQLSSAGDLWICTYGAGLKVLDAQSGELVDIAIPDNASVDTTSFTALAEAPDGSIWAGLNGPGIYRVDRETGGSTLIPLESVANRPSRVRDLLVDNFGRVWIAGLSAGLQRYEPGTKSLVSYPVAPNTSTSVGDADTYSLFLDLTGVLWIGTLSAGFETLDLYSGGFELFRKDGARADGLSHNMVTSFLEDPSGAILIGTDGGGLNHFEPGSRHFEAFTPSNSGLGDDRIWDLHRSQTGQLWIGSWGGGLFAQSTAGGAIVDVWGSDDAYADAPDNIIALTDDKRGRLWIGTVDRGVWTLDIESGQLQQLEPVDADGEVLDIVRVSALHTDDRGSIWLAASGLDLIEVTPDGDFRRLDFSDDQIALPGSRVLSITEGNNDTLLLATSGGLAVMDLASRKLVLSMGADDGMPPGVLYGALQDQSGRIWVSSNRGVVRVDPETGTTRNFTPRDGLQGYEYNRGAALVDSTGHLYFGGTAGFNRFFPDDIRDNPIPPPVSLTRFFLFGEEQRPRDEQSIVGRHVSYLPFVELEHRQNVVSLQFAALHFVAPERNRYRYRLDGFDRDWTSVAADGRLVTYTNLDPGDYRFRVQGANSDGVWSTDEATLDINVLAPWWETPPALLAYAVLALLAVSAFVRWRTLSLRAQAAELKRTVDERTELVTRQKETIEEQATRTAELLHAKEQLFARVSHEFRTPLTLILGAADRLEPGTDDTKHRQRVTSIKNSGDRLLRLVNQLLDITRNDENDIDDAVPQDFGAVVQAAVDGFDGLSRTQGVSLDAHIDEGARVLAPPASLEPLILNLLSNAFKFTPRGGSVTVRLDANDANTQLTVQDTGPGIPEELLPTLFEPFMRGTAPGAGSGIGLALVRETSTALGGSVRARNRVNGGAEFVIILPVTELSPDVATGASTAGVAQELAYAERALQKQTPAQFQDAAVRSDGPAEVLVVEDEAELRGFLVETIGEHYRVRSENDGAAALAAIRDNAPDIVVSDIMMPTMDGFELCNAIKTDERTSHVPVVLLTALGDQSNLMRGLEEGADEYLTKPFNADELLLRLRNLLETRRMLQLRVAQRLAVAATEGEPAVAGLGKRDRAFLDRLDRSLEARYADASAGIADLAGDLAMSSRQLQRKLKSLTNLSPSEYLRAYRLRKAAALLKDGGNPGEVAFATGFNSQSHFGACFKAYFGATPGEYRESAA